MGFRYTNIFPSSRRFMDEWMRGMFGHLTDPYDQKHTTKWGYYLEPDKRFDLIRDTSMIKPQDVVQSWKLPQDETPHRLSSKIALYGTDEEKSELEHVSDTDEDKMEDFSVGGFIELGADVKPDTL